MFPANEPWILQNYDHILRSDANSSERVDTIFNANTGFPERRRVRLNAGSLSNRDLLQVFCPSSRGDLEEEHYFGGDFSPITGAPNPCSSPTVGEYALRHTYT